MARLGKRERAQKKLEHQYLADARARARQVSGPAIPTTWPILEAKLIETSNGAGLSKQLQSMLHYVEYGDPMVRDDHRVAKQREIVGTRKGEASRANLPDNRPNLSGRDIHHEDELRINRAWVNYPK